VINQAGDGRIDSLIAHPSNPSVGYGILPDGVYRSTVVDPGTGAVQVIRLAPARTAGFTDATGYYAHQLATNGACVFYTSEDGVGFVSDDGKSSGMLANAPAPERRALGVALGQFPGNPGRQALYYTIFAPMNQGGGVYYMDLPVACGGSGGGGGGLDAGADGKDAGP
jgi:hypothetical protein